MSEREAGPIRTRAPFVKADEGREVVQELGGGHFGQRGCCAYVSRSVDAGAILAMKKWTLAGSMGDDKNRLVGGGFPE